ncbi:MAG: hypothetical protein ACRCVA_10315 [Phreatobacter sp.]
MSVIGSSGFYDLSPYQQSQVWSSKRASAVNDSLATNNALINSLSGESNSVISVLSGAVGGDGSLVSMLGGSSTTSGAADANALFGGGLGNSPEEALQNAVTGGKSTDAIAQENLMAKVIKSRQAKEAEAKAGAKVNMIA